MFVALWMRIRSYWLRIRGNILHGLPVLNGKSAHFSAGELLSVLDYFEHQWPGVDSLAPTVKTALWTWARVAELANLSSGSLRIVDQESHFEIVGKWGVERSDRIPDGLLYDLQRLRTSNRFVFAAYNQELRSFYLSRNQSRFAERVGAAFSPTAFASWFQARIGDWATEMRIHWATPHIFRRLRCNTLDAAKISTGRSPKMPNSTFL